MSGRTSLRKIQFGQEAPAGTAVVATTIWRGLGTLEDLREKIWPEESVGYLSGLDRAYEPTLGGQIELETVEATFEQVNHLFEMGIKAVGTGVADGGGTGKVYTYGLPTTASNVVKTYTIEAGDDQRKKEIEYCFAETITLEGKFGEALKVSATLQGRQVTGGIYETGIDLAFVNATSKITDVSTDLILFLTGTSIKVSGSASNDGILTVATGGVAAEIVTTEALVEEVAGETVTIEDWFTGGPTGIALPTVEEILFSSAKVYIDAVAGTIGTTPVSDTVKEASVQITTGVVAHRTASGAKYFSHIEYGPPEITLEITMLYNGEAVDEERLWEAGTSQMIRLNFEGTALGTAAAYTYKTLNIDLAGQWEKFDRLESEDGIDTIKGTFRCRYNVTAALFATLTLVNELATVP